MTFDHEVGIDSLGKHLKQEKWIEYKNQTQYNTKVTLQVSMK
jgi:hypothetical protein